MKKTKTSKKKQKNPLVIPKTARESIPYRYVYPDTGIIEIKKGVFSKTYLLGDINYKDANEDVQDNLMFAFMKVLNGMDSYVQCQETIFNKNIGIDEIKEKAFYKLVYDGFDDLRVELNERREKLIVEGKNNLIKEKYYTVSVQEESYEEAVSTFSRLDSELAKNFDAVGGATATPLNTTERLALLHSIYNMDRAEDCPLYDEGFDLTALKKQGVTSKDVIGPSGFQFKYDHMMVGSKFARALYLKVFPNTLDDDILEELTNVNCSSLTSVNFYSIPSDVALKTIGYNITANNSELIDKMKKAGKGGYAADPELLYPNLSDSQKELFKLRDDLSHNDQKMFYMNLIIVHFADSKEELDNDTESIVAAGRKKMAVIDNLLGQQALGLDSALPLAYDRVEIKKRLLSQSLAAFTPFVSKELQHSTGIIYGQHGSSRNIIRINRKTLPNGNGFIFGQPGSGKSMEGKDEIFNTFLGYPEDVVYVIDPNGEYAPIAELLNGTVIKISPESDSHINPLDFHENLSNGKDPIWYKTDFLINVFESSILQDRFGSGLTAGAKTIIDSCTRQLYMKYFEELKAKGQEPSVKTNPTLVDFYELLKNQPGREARDLAKALQLYATGSLNYFSHRTNVEVNNRFVVFDISGMGNALKTMGLLIVLDFIWRKTIENGLAGIYTWFYIDESHLLYRNENTAGFVRDVYKQARKYGGINTSITQNVEDLMMNDTARTMISNSSFVVMLRQSTTDKQMLAELLNIPESQLKFITETPPGHGLIYTGEKSIVPFINKIGPGKLYDAMTTKVGEKKIENVNNDKVLAEYT